MIIIWGSANAMSRDFATQVLMEKQPGLMVKPAATLEECRDLAQSEITPDLIILDSSLPDLESVEGFIQFGVAVDHVAPRVVMGPATSVTEIREFLRVGAAGYLSHAMNADGIIGAVNLIAAGEKYVPPDLINHEANLRDVSMLTVREQEVLQGLMAGRSNKEIATQLNLSEVTIKHHLKGLRSKLGARNRTHAVCRAIELGIT